MTRVRARLLFLVTLALLSCSAIAESERIGLVLGGGGARGAAHVGVLKVLEEQGIAVDVIAGTSMGAIVGALYASGYRADDIEAIVERIDWAGALSDQPDRTLLSPQRKADAALIPSSLEIGIGRDGLRIPQGLIQGQNLGLLLRELLLHVSHVDHFDRLPIPFRAVAADLVSGESVVLESGDLVDAVRASMSVPGAFQPLRIGDRLLVDGGVVDNVPIDVARAMGATRLIVVDVGSGLADEDEMGSPASVTMQVISILMERQTQRTLELLEDDDVLIRPVLRDIGSADFDRAGEAVPLGEAAANANVEQLQPFAADARRLAAFEGRARPEWQADRPIDRIAVNPSLSRSAFLVEDRLRPLLGAPADPERIEARIGEIYGEGHYERIIYRLEDKQGRLVLHVTPVDKSWGPNFLRLGLRLSDDFDGGSTYQLEALARMASDIRPGAEWRVRLALGELNELAAAWRVPFGRKARAYVQPYASARALDQPLFVDDQRTELARLRWSRGRFGAELGNDWNTSTRTFVRLERGADRLSRKIGSGGIGAERVRQDYGFAALGIVRDSLDDATFPTRGTLLDGRVEFYQPALGSETTAEVLRFDLTRAFSLDRYLLLAGVRAVSGRSDEVSLQAVDFLGGLGNLSGYGERELGGPQLFLARTLLMRRMGEVNQLFSLPTYLGISLEAGNVWQRRADFELNDLIYSGALYLGVSTPLGPIFLGYGRSSEGQSSIYLNFGSLIRSRHL
ncbi:patatin-like phospholipase family protein [Wenzhouxiangella limi]|uniref:BamA/TamA family outer membrane protein n=1 Tax=Wenzhouxiangella limi TaxID=2707351 RepID=A0A845V3V3_9GAMM|nr:patatin-like phospholipase family protein [Wenzhouxiangella limi]NDY96960.1 BamA/TamA family outer membrane protein [Wenzhouxiangella limi]